MRVPIQLSLISGLLFFFSACQKEQVNDSFASLDHQLQTLLDEASGNKGIQHYIFPSSNDFSSIPQDPLNPLSVEKVELGKMLYHETGLAISPKMDIGKGTYSCASCHHANAGFQAGRFQGISDGGIGFGQEGANRIKNPAYKAEDLDVQPIRTPTTLNVAYQANMLWNGQFGATGANVNTEYAWKEGTPIETNFLGFEGVEIQAIAGLKVHRMGIDSTLINNTDYQRMFAAAFGNLPESERFTNETMGQAIAAYERTLLANEAPFQRWLQGDETAMSDPQKQGALLFFGKAECSNCHNGPALNNLDFHALGMADLVDYPGQTFMTKEEDPTNLGRASFTGEEADNYKFKTPQLYNLKDSPFLGHGGNFRTIRSVVAYKNEAQAENAKVPISNLDPAFKPLNLSDAEINDLTAFISNALYDPNLRRYLPDHLPSNNCFPVNDSQSQLDLGCK